jgi:hypothetical protein
MMGPDSVTLGIAPLGANFFETILEKGVDYLQSKAAAYTSPKAASQTAIYAPPSPAPIIVRAAAPTVERVPEPMIPTWGWIAIGVGAAALVTGGAVLLAKRS